MKPLDAAYSVQGFYCLGLFKFSHKAFVHPFFPFSIFSYTLAKACSNLPVIFGS